MSSNLASDKIGIFYSISAMLVFQIGMALSVPILLSLGAGPSTWLRLMGAALVLILLSKPKMHSYRKETWLLIVSLGISTAGMSVAFAEAAARIPIGMATAIEFAGPLFLSFIFCRRATEVLFVLIATAGVYTLTLSDASLQFDPFGIAFAFAAAVFWSLYILLTKKSSEIFGNLSGLAASITIAAIVATPYGIIQLRPDFSMIDVAISLGLGAVVPVIPYALELSALRRMTARSFSIVMSNEPALSAFIGWLVLGQSLGMKILIGIACVVVGSAGAVVVRIDRQTS